MKHLKVGSELIETIKLNYKADMPVMLTGATGIGKSDSLKRAADELGIECCVLDLSLMEPVDLVGLPIMSDGVTHFAPPSFLPTADKGLLVFEEMNRAPRHTLAPCLQLLSDRKLNEYTLPEGWLPVAAINPADDEEYHVEELDKALLARFVQLGVEADVAHWVKWANDNAIHPKVIRFVESTSNIFRQPQSNPRAWTYVSKILTTAQAEGIEGGPLKFSVAGLVGDALCQAFFQQAIDDLDAKDVIFNLSTVRNQIAGWVETENTSAISSLSSLVMQFLQHPNHAEDVRECPQSRKNLGEFLNMLPEGNSRANLQERYDDVFNGDNCLDDAA